MQFYLTVSCEWWTCKIWQVRYRNILLLSHCLHGLIALVQRTFPFICTSNCLFSTDNKDEETPNNQTIIPKLFILLIITGSKLPVLLRYKYGVYPWVTASSTAGANFLNVPAIDSHLVCSFSCLLSAAFCRFSVTYSASIRLEFSMYNSLTVLSEFVDLIICCFNLSATEIY